MRGQAGFFDIVERLKEFSAKGDQLERLSAIVNVELFRPDLVRAVPRSDGTRIHRKKPKGKPMPAHIARANGAKAKMRAAVEHVFAHEKGPMGLVVRTIGLARARVKIGLSNLVYDMKRALWLTKRRAE